MPPSKNELFKRLLNRDQNDEKNVNERMKQFTEDVLHWINYDFVVINDDLNNCYNKIKTFINLRKENSQYKGFDKELIKKHVESLLN